MAEALDALGFDEDVTVVGHSLGGAIAVELAALGIGSGLALLAPAGFARVPIERLVALMPIQVAALKHLDRWESWPVRHRWARRATFATLAPDAGEFTPDDTRILLRGAARATQAVEAARSIAQTDVAATAATLDLPTIACWGTRDAVVPAGSRPACSRPSPTPSWSPGRASGTCPCCSARTWWWRRSDPAPNRLGFRAVQPGEGRLVWDEGTTWYRVVGEAVPGRRPVVICHGGPGAAHDYVERIANLSRDGRQCILYDQLGCGKSEHLSHQGARFWTVDLFLRELDAARSATSGSPAATTSSASPGAGCSAWSTPRRPPALRSLVVCDSPASMSLWVEEAMRLRRDCRRTSRTRSTATRPPAPPAIPSTSRRRSSSTSGTSAASSRSRTTCSGRSTSSRDPTVYNTMNGPNEFHVIGTLRDWDITARLPGSTCRRCSCRAPTTRPRRGSCARSRPGSRSATGCCSTTRATCRTSRSPSVSSRSSAAFLRRLEAWCAESTADALLARLAKEQADERAPSIVAGLVRDGALVWSAGRGRVDGERPDATSKSTR